MKIIKILILVCFLTISAFAQQGANITGILTAKNGKPLANVEIKLEKDSVVIKEGSTDEKGNFFLDDVPDGVYSFVYTDENGNAVREIIEVKNGRNINRVSGNRISELVTISADTNQTVEEVSKSVNLIEAQELRERADFALVETLRIIPGFRVQQLGGFGRTATIKTRGLRNQDTAVLIDGIRFRDASSITGDASAFLSDFTLTSVSRIEVLRGSGSSLYGTNAIGGAVDFQTPKPQTGFHGQLSGAFGGLGLKRIRGNVSNGIKDGKFGFNLGVSRTIYSEGIDEDDDAHNTNFQSRIEYNPFEKTNISARFFVSDAFVKLNSNPDTIGNLPTTNATIINAVPLSRSELKRYENGTPSSQLNVGNGNFIPDANDPDAFQKSQFFNGQLVLTQILKSNLVFQGFYSGLKTNRKNTNGVLGIGFQPFGSAENSVFDGQIHTFNGHFNWTPNRSNEITFGYEFEREKFGNEGFTSNVTDSFTTHAGQSSNTLYVQDLLKFFDNRLQIAGGFRAQFFNLENPTFSGTNPPYQNVRLENPPSAYTFDGATSYYFAKTGTKIRAHVGNGYRVPSLYERFGTFYATFLTPNRFVPLGAPDLKPERSIAFDGGVDQTLFDNRAKLSAVYFYTRLTDTIGYGTLPQPDPFGRINSLSGGGYFNTKGGISRGAEFSADVKPSDSTSVFASYTFTNSDQRTPQVSGSRILQTLGIPVHQFTLVATQRLGKRFSVNFDFLATSNYLAPIFDTNNFTFRSYVYRFNGARKGDLTARYEIPAYQEKLRFVVFGTIENVFDYDYYENGFRTFGRIGRIGFGVNF
ncbi:MAG: TonB-dependent receptor plug domain-containing protein [Pyrinomonadaceae bacterium]